MQDAIHVIDNDGVTYSIIRGTCDVHMIRDMLYKYALQEVQKSLLIWAARVPSPSNCADAPSGPSGQLEFRLILTALMHLRGASC